MGGQGTSGVGLKAAGHVLEVKPAVGGADGLFVFARPFEQFVIHQRIGNLPVVIAQKAFIRSRPQDDVRRFHVNDVVAFLPEFVVDEAGGARQKFRAFPVCQPELFRRLHRVASLDPAVEDDILAQNVYLHVRMAGDLGADFVLGTPGLPELEALAGHINGQRLLCTDADARRAGLTLAQFHEQRKFLKRTVELRVDELVDRERVERDNLADARPFDDEVQGPAVHQARGHAINRAGAFEPLAVGFEPFVGIPVFRQQIFPERQAEARQEQFPAIIRLQAEIIHAQQRHGGARRHLRQAEQLRIRRDILWF